MARVTMSDATVWRLFFKALSRAEARRKVTIDGRADIGAAVFAVAAVMV